MWHTDVPVTGNLHLERNQGGLGKIDSSSDQREPACLWRLFLSYQ